MEGKCNFYQHALSLWLKNSTEFKINTALKREKKLALGCGDPVFFCSFKRVISGGR